MPGQTVHTPQACAEFFQSQRLSTTITESLSTVEDDDGNFCIEPGVLVEIYTKEAHKSLLGRLWPVLQSHFPIECAHVQTHDFAGCIFDFLRPSSCPFTVRKSVV